MEAFKKQKREIKPIDNVLSSTVILLLLKLTIDQFFFELFPTVGDYIF
ncbi:hypothetical protein [Oceanobacillus kapialis]|uniref:Preprotein translocase subunit SecE n=1 Tax=Oceanobacillus kapialis TaxID=481353 RepID=A0ABW5Q2P6_9BACI